MRLLEPLAVEYFAASSRRNNRAPLMAQLARRLPKVANCELPNDHRGGPGRGDDWEMLDEQPLKARPRLRQRYGYRVFSKRGRGRARPSKIG